MAGVADLGEDAPPLMNYGPKSEQNPGALYHHMLKGVAPFEKWLFTSGREYPLLRQQQELVSKTVPGVWMTTSGDAGMQWDIHPKEKKPISRFPIRLLSFPLSAAARRAALSPSGTDFSDS